VGGAAGGKIGNANQRSRRNATSTLTCAA